MSEPRMSVAGAAARGAVAGIAGGVVLRALWGFEEGLLPPERRTESPTGEVVEKMAEEHGVQLSRTQVRAAAALGYTGSMAVWGAVYGMVQSRVHPPMLVHGLLLGGLVYAANFAPGAALPKQGIVAPPEGLDRELFTRLGAHAVFGLTTAAVFEALG